MTPESFAYWLQGFFELSGTDKLTEKQVKIVKDHLALVFQKVTPDRSKKKVKKPINGPPDDLICAPASEKPISVFPGANIEEIRLNIEKAMEKRAKEMQEDIRVTCDASPTSEELMETVKESARKSKERQTYPSPTRWIGGISGQKYC